MSNQSPIAREKILYSNKDMEDAIKIFKAKKIPVYERGEDDHERYIATANLIYRFSSPPCVVQPKCACDVRDVIKIAKSRKIPITIKNGGHSYAGGSTTNIGILMELGLMNDVNLDKTSETVTVKGGALWFHVYKKLVSKHLDGFVVNGGRCPTVGVSGFMLGGGLAPFTRSFGMGCDTVKEFTIVTATGDEVTVSENNGGDKDKDNLFWALRGAGGGNFGVVVEMKLALKKLKSDLVVAGRYTWYPEKDEASMGAFMATMNSFYTRNWPNEMTIDSSWLCNLKETKSDLGVRFLVYYNGGRTAFNQAIDAWTLTDAPSQHGQLKEQLKTRSLQEPSSRFLHETLAAQWVEETKKALPTTNVYQIYTSFVFQNGSEKIGGITRIIREEMQKFRNQFAGETGLMQVTFIHSGGEANSKKREDMAFRWRRSIYHTYIMLQWDEKWLEEPMRRFLGQMKPRLSEYGMVKGATFINFPDDALKSEAHEQAYYGNNRQKLRDIKQTWDPDNFFKWSQGIRLPAEANQKNTTKAASTSGETDSDLGPDQILIKEEALTDVIALQQWESYRPPTPTDFYGSGALPTLVS
jgi:FAD/FMN-containing dehydrogenase